jgi:hypothetical protein
MGDIKPWQIVVLVAAVVVVIASAYLTFGRSDMPEMASELTLVDITTGDMFIYPLSGHRALSIPGKNPDTGKAALFPVGKDESGVWTVSLRDLGSLSLVEGEPAALTNRKTGEVRVTSEKPRRMR